MALEQDTYNVLKAIEKHLAESSRSFGAFGGQATKSGNTNRYDSAAARAEESQLQHTKKLTVSTGKAVERLGAVSHKSATQLEGFNRQTGAATGGLGNFTSVIAKSIGQITAKSIDLSKIDMTATMTALQAAVSDAATSIKSNNLAKGDTTGFAKTMGTLDTIVDNQVNPRLGSFASALGLATQTLVAAWDSMRESRDEEGTAAKTFGKNMNMAISALERRGGIGAQLEIMRRRLVAVNNALRSTGSLVRSGGGGGGTGSRSAPGDDSDDAPASKSNGKKELGGLLGAIWKPLEIAGGIAANRMVTSFIKIVDEAFQTTGARGFGTMSTTFLSLSGDAIMAGMSLQDFVQMLEKNEGTVSRFGSFAAFNDQLDVGRDQLKKFGIFGLEATNLSAAMVNSAQSLGVPVQDLSKSINGQLGVFEQLRKSTGITAEQFEQLNRDLQDNEVVQRELIGLAPDDRAARLTQLTQTATWGRQLGLTTRAATELQNALINQRKSTVKERFQARGRLQQSLALTGTDPAVIAEATALASKRNRTTEEDQRLTRILADNNARNEEIKASGNEGMANAIEVSEQNLNETSLGDLNKASVAVKAAVDSGAQINKDMGKQLGIIGKTLGDIFTVLEGLGKSSIFQFGVGAFAGAVILGLRSTNLQLGTLPARIAAALRLGGGVGSGLPGSDDFMGPDRPGDKRGKPGIGKRLGMNAKNIAKGAGLGSLVGVGFAAVDYANAEEDAKVENGGDGDAGKKRGEAIGEGMGSVAGGIIGAMLGSFIPVLGTAIGGVLGSFLGGWVGKIGGAFFGAESASEKNAKELNKNTKQLIEARRQTATSSVISTNNLSSLSSSVLQTGRAYADLTEVERQKIQDDINKTTQSSASPTKTSSIATPTSTTPTSVNQDAVNTAATEAAVNVAEVRAAATTASALPTGDQASTLAEILRILTQSLTAENTQVELATQLLQRTSSGRLPDRNMLMDQAIRTA